MKNAAFLRRPEDGSPRFHSLWAINAGLEGKRLRTQLDRMKEAGLDGVVFHPRFYPGAPPYLSSDYMAAVSEAILHAKSLGLAFWIYDENGWPSGTAGGQLLARHPGDAQRWAGLVSKKPERVLAEFVHAGQRWYLGEHRGPGVDYFSRSMTDHFIAMTYDRYATGLAPEAFGHVEAFFCDEPEFGLGHAYDMLPPAGAIPWTPDLPELFRRRHGCELIPLVPQLFFPEPGYEEMRIRFWELLTDVFCENFLAPLNEWCRRHGKLFTAHVKGEEHPLFQVPTSGSCSQVFRHLSLPGIDALERSPSNDFYTRQASTVARQFGDGRCMAEAFGGSGWGGTPDDLERYLLWLGRNGLTDFVMHLSQYRVDSAALCDWPPSQPLHLTWSHLYPEVLDRVRRELRVRSRDVADTLLVAPYRAIMAHYDPADLPETNVHNAAYYPASPAGGINTRFMELVESLQRSGIAFDVVDERTIDQCAAVSQDRLQIGRGLYRHVVLDASARLAESSRSMLAPFVVPHWAATSNHAVVISERPSEAVVPVRWRLAEHPDNSLLLEPKACGDGWFQGGFAARDLPSDSDLALVFADKIAELSLNGSVVKSTPTEEGTLASLAASWLRDENVVRFRPAHPVEHPFVWLQGRFRVRSASPFVDGPGNTRQTGGPFVIEPERPSVSSDLVADGFPFLGRTLKLQGEVMLPFAVSSFALIGGAADAVQLTVNGTLHRWRWPLGGPMEFDSSLPAGRHLVEMELVPNGFNLHGPHHYFKGDWHVISPDQIRGRKNFADPPDAPSMTHVAAWHFRRFELPTGIALTTTAGGLSGAPTTTEAS